MKRGLKPVQLIRRNMKLTLIQKLPDEEGTETRKHRVGHRPEHGASKTSPMKRGLKRNSRSAASLGGLASKTSPMKRGLKLGPLATLCYRQQRLQKLPR